jgi:hypothetical protein
MRKKLQSLSLIGVLAAASGCNLVLPEVIHQPVIRNPFPQLSRVAIAPFFNQSDESTVDGRQFALAYFAELQSTPGFEVVPLGVVEEAILDHKIDLSGPGEARRLARILGVDAVVVGSVTDYSPYYPPRCGLQVEWYTANSGFHEIPTGYGLPWNTPEEEFIPDELVYQAQLEYARDHMSLMSPDCNDLCEMLPQPPPGQKAIDANDGTNTKETNGVSNQKPFQQSSQTANMIQPVQAEMELRTGGNRNNGQKKLTLAQPSGIAQNGTTTTADSLAGSMLGVDSGIAPGCAPLATPDCWLDHNYSLPAPRQGSRPPYALHHGPVLRHNNIYNGHDPHLTQALQGYVNIRDDARFGGWESYLQRSDDFIRFCCHMHISEMLSARGGSRKTRVVWRWPESR